MAAAVCENYAGSRKDAASAAEQESSTIFRMQKAQIYWIYGYVKSEREDLTPDQVRTLAKLMKDMKENDHG